MSQLSFSQVLIFIACSISLTLTYNYFTTTSNQILREQQQQPMTTTAVKNISKAMTTNLSSAKIVRRPSSARGHADHGWLNSFHTFSFANYWDPRHESFGALRVLNEDRVAPHTGFPTHPHRDAEIFSYILSGQLTHRDSMTKKGSETKANKDQFYRMERGDVQFTTGGSGIAHSEQNEHDRDWVHFLQIWATPWKRGLKPNYHTSTFSEADKRKAFVPIISPLKAGINATAEDEAAAIPAVDGTIPVHADLLFSAGIIAQGEKFDYKIGGSGDNDDHDTAVSSKTGRKTYIHLPMTKGGKAKIRLDGRDDAILNEGDGAYISNVNAGQILSVESIGEAEAEVVVLDSN